MYGQVMLLAVGLLGVDAGWQRRADDGLDYLIQIQPPLMRALEAGQTLESELPPQLRGKVYAYKITVGTKKLPQEPGLDELNKTSSMPGAPNLPGTTMSPPGPPLPQMKASGSGSPFSSNQWPGTFAAKPPVDAPPTTAAGTTSGTVSTTSTSATGPAAASNDMFSPARLWMYLIVALVALAGSVSWNVYLLWMLKEARKRYRTLLQRSGLTQDELDEEEEQEEEEEEEEE